MKRAAAAAERLAALGLFAALAVLYCAPAVWSWRTAVIGLKGDTGFGLWNLWYFRHALTHGINPLWTDLQYWPYGANLILHHDTLFNDALAYFLLPRVGLVGAYNLLSLLGLTLSGWGVYLFSRDFGETPAPSFAAGALYAFGPATTCLMFRVGTGPDYLYLAHLPFFVWALARTARGGKLFDAALAALALTWVWTFNYYYFLFCGLLVPVFWVLRERPAAASLARRTTPAAALRTLEVLAAAAALAALVLGPRGGFHGRGSTGAILLKVAPFLAFWALIGARVLAAVKPRLRLRREAFAPRAWLAYAAIPGFWALMNLPLIAASLYFIATGDYGTATNRWRGGGNPADPLWLLLPGWQHPWWGAAVARLGSVLGPPNVTSLGLAPLIGAFWLWKKKAFEKDAWLGLWLAAGFFSLVITLGPWLKVAGVDTYLPMPFYFLHLLPVFNNLQHGLRFNVFIALFLSLLFAAALGRLWRSGRRGPALALAALAALECWPGPAPSLAWEPPALFQRLRARPDGAVLPVPVGAIFNGLSSVGAMGSLWVDTSWQAAFEKPIVGGYFTRVSRRQYDRMKGDAMIQAVISAQSGGPAAAALTDRTRVARWLRDNRLSYVLVSDALVPDALKSALRAWPLTIVDEGDGCTLYAVKKGDTP